ncbi:hypothetical protein AAGG74_16305 [Bacillus mexicanus]|uniref:hypothetical protein n=1 Tax=Bacillus mexicanus TaxID=2834415 RepID=UPI003D1DBDCA
MNIRIFMYGNKNLAFSILKEDVVSEWDKVAVCNLIELLLKKGGHKVNYYQEKLDEILKTTNYNPIAFRVVNQNLVYFDPSKYFELMDDLSNENFKEIFEEYCKKDKIK